MKDTPLHRLRPAIYELAASRIITRHDNCCCHAIAHAVHGPGYRTLDDSEPHTRALLDLFAPLPGSTAINQPAYYWNDDNFAERQEARVIALLTLAAMVRAAKQGGAR